MNSLQRIQRPRGHVRPSPIVAERVRAFVTAYGERAAVEHFGLSRISVARVAAGLPCYGGTLFLIEDGLQRIEEHASDIPDTKDAR